LRQSEKDILDINNYNNNNCALMMIERINYLDLIMFPVLLDDSFFILVVALLSSKRLYVVSPVSLESYKGIIAITTKKLINYIICISRMIGLINVKDWTVYIDRESPIKPSLSYSLQDTKIDSGIYISCYMIEIGLHDDVTEIIKCFQNYDYYILFENIKHETVYFKRKMLAVLINDADYFLAAN
jgi:hypothetical protein